VSGEVLCPNLTDDPGTIRMTMDPQLMMSAELLVNSPSNAALFTGLVHLCLVFVFWVLSFGIQFIWKLHQIHFVFFVIVLGY